MLVSSRIGYLKIYVVNTVRLDGRSIGELEGGVGMIMLFANIGSPRDQLPSKLDTYNILLSVSF